MFQYIYIYIKYQEKKNIFLDMRLIFISATNWNWASRGSTGYVFKIKKERKKRSLHHGIGLAQPVEPNSTVQSPWNWA